MKNQKTKEKFVELRAEGLSFDRISKKLRTSKQTLIDWSKEFGREISLLKAVELEALHEQYFMSKERRIVLFGEKLKSIKGELDKRKLKDISTDKLFDLLIKYDTVLQQEVTELSFAVENINGLNGIDRTSLTRTKVEQLIKRGEALGVSKRRLSRIKKLSAEVFAS